MVRVEIRQTTDATVLVEATADDRGIHLAGPWAERLALDEPQLGLPSGRLVSAESRPEEWVRGLIVAFRSPDLLAEIVHDDEPLHDEAPVEVAAGAAH